MRINSELVKPMQFICVRGKKCKVCRSRSRGEVGSLGEPGAGVVGVSDSGKCGRVKSCRGRCGTGRCAIRVWKEEEEEWHAIYIITHKLVRNARR